MRRHRDELGDAPTAAPCGRRPRRWARRLVSLTAVATAIVLLGALTSPVASAPVGTDPDGEWSAVENWPLIALHAALTPDGNVVTYGTNENGRQGGSFIYDVWDSSGSAGTGHTTLPNQTSTDIFCSIQVVRPDSGDLVLFGGDNVDVDGYTTNTGNPDINVYDPDTGSLSTIGTMQRGRWYATSTTLPDGRVYVQGGYDTPGVFYGNDIAEVWTEGTGAQGLPFATNHLNYFYPRNFVTPDGRIFGFDTGGRMYTVSQDLQTMTSHGQLPWANTGLGSSAVMFEPGLILQFGGRSNQAIIIDITGPTPVVTATDSMSKRRDWVTGTLLPDGRVLATGGSAVYNEMVDVSYAAEIWDPATGMWTTHASAVKHRLYHSTALLLPDGRVLTAGGGAPGPTKELNAEIYSPDYLVASGGGPVSRPAITAAPVGPHRPGDLITVSVDDATDIDRVTLVKTGSVTHSFNVDQRFLEPAWTATGNDLAVTLPANPAELTPGFYLVTVIDDDGIPSESEIVQVMPPRPAIEVGPAQVTEGAAGSSAVVSIPVTLSAPSLEQVAVDWATADVPGDNTYASATEGDYTAASGSITFPPGTASVSVDVTVHGDDVDELDETIQVLLSNPTNAVLGAGPGGATIADDDAPPTLSPGGYGTAEGHSGSQVFAIPITLSAPSSHTITIDYMSWPWSGDGFATEGVDYDPPAPGTLTFLPGETSKTVPVTVHGDTDVEPSILWGEWFFVRFLNPSNAVLDQSFFGLGAGIIGTDD